MKGPPSFALKFCPVSDHRVVGTPRSKRVNPAQWSNAANPRIKTGHTLHPCCLPRRWPKFLDEAVVKDDPIAVNGLGLGRSHGRRRSKIHVAVEWRGPPISVILIGGNTGDNPQLIPLLDQISGRHPA